MIAIRNDVTQLHLVKESLSRALQRSDSDLDEAFHLSKQYETVIDESNSLTRVDTEGKILFVNKRFCELSGYAKEEVIEQSFSAMYADDIDPLIVKQLWETIQSGHVWRGVLKNKRKDGSLYWVKATVVPIKDKQGKITEFMSVRNDISEIIKLHEEIESTQQEIIYHMGEIAESRSQETGNHVRRVAEYSRLLALKYGLDAQEANKIAMASPMHDIGKVGIPDAILHKPGKLTDEEWEIMKTHAMLGYAVLQHSKRPILQASAIIAKEHHEKYDGTGYPLGLSGETIHLYARIVAIADVFDALSHDRCYKKAWEDADVFAFFEKERGAHFDPNLVDMFLAAKEEFLTIRDHFKDALNP
ncbi:MAG: PAS domain S-box protein [Epsilonproteobacteria bacterium]|nr:PAS domain S-box protein [Campylobacterota bacterium]